MKQTTLKLKTLSALVALVLLSAACNGAYSFTGQTSSAILPALNSATPTSVPTAPQTVAPTAVAVPSSLVDQQAVLVNLYARWNPSVVQITNYALQQGQDVAQGLGSGFLYDTQGHIVTNAHVVEGSNQLDVTFPDGTVTTAQVVGKDLNSDLAVVKVKFVPSGVNPIPLGDYSTLAVGQTVVAIGNPFGLDSTLTVGVISALGRSIPALTAFSIPDAIQTDAAINPGNSGGPLLDLNGTVIGINAQIETGGTGRANTGVGFAIPVSVIKKVVPALIDKGSYQWSWMGVKGGTLNPTMVEAMNLSVSSGAYISEITPGGPAEKTGLRGTTGQRTVSGRLVEVGGDVITAVDGHPVRNFYDVMVYVALQTTPGQSVAFTIIRDGKEQTFSIVMGVRPEQPEMQPVSLP